jgi:hypothetical protein
MKMHKGRNAKYVMDVPKANATYPAYRTKTDPKIVKPIVTVDDQTVPDAQFYADTKWILPGTKGELKLAETHSHEFGEMLGFFGYNYDNIQDLGAELEIVIDGETNIVDRSFTAYIPPGVKHGPIIIRNVTRPIFFVSSGRHPRYE